jgi:hypothetical protein
MTGKDHKTAEKAADQKRGIRHRVRRARRIQRAVTLAAFGAAITEQLRKPPEQRTWEGRLLGVVPYSLQRPTLARAKARVWAPDGPLFVPKVFGIGWDLNLGRLVRLVRGR